MIDTCRPACSWLLVKISLYLVLCGVVGFAFGVGTAALTDQPHTDVGISGWTFQELHPESNYPYDQTSPY